GNVTVTIGAQASNNLKFVPRQLVPPPPPTLTSINLNSGIQSQSNQVTLTGTNFVIGATSVIVSGNGVTAGAVTVTNSTTLNTTLLIAGQAATGPRGVTVATSGGTSNPVTFTVLAVPALSSMNPAFGLAGATFPVT